MKVPVQRAVTLPSHVISDSIVARLPSSAATRAVSLSGRSDGVGRRSLTWKSAVTVHGNSADGSAWWMPQAAVQLQWQSSSAPMIPPLSTPGNAWWCSSGGPQSQTTSSPAGNESIRRPLSFFGPHPKQIPSAPNLRCNDNSPLMGRTMPPLMAEIPRTVDAIDWDAWQPTERATLLFVLAPPNMLLIRKKRGLGAGKINAPGGRLDPGETDVQAAVREVQEELHVTALNPVRRGDHSFQFVDGYRLYVTVFVATEWTGTPTETDEAIPLWIPFDAVPYDEMWADDVYWLPELLAGRDFSTRSVFDGDAMLDFVMEVSGAARPVRGP